MLDMHVLAFEPTPVERSCHVGMRHMGGRDCCGDQHAPIGANLYPPTVTDPNHELMLLDTLTSTSDHDHHGQPLHDLAASHVPYQSTYQETTHPYNDGFYHHSRPLDNDLAPLPSIYPNVSQSINFRFDDDQDSDGGWTSDEMDDDDFEDDEEDLHSPDPESPEQLLNFARTVTADLQAVLCRNRGADDYCDIYEERFKSVLSGREMYYRDLLALASNGGDSETTGKSKRRRSSKMVAAERKSGAVTDGSESGWCDGRPRERTEHTFVYDLTGEPTMWKVPHQGRLEVEYGLGPLEELFVPYAGAWRLGEPSSNSGYCTLEYMPMTKRKLPTSFWEEPGGVGEQRTMVVASVGQTADFNDFFTSWATM